MTLSKKLKKGLKVKIKGADQIKELRSHAAAGFVPGMDIYCGRTATITHLADFEDWFKINEDGSSYWWSIDMITMDDEYDIE